LAVTAKDRASGKEQSITITGASTLDKSDVERMVRDAETHAAADRRRREQIDTKNNADALAYQAEKQLQDLNGKVSDADRNRAQALIHSLREAIDREDYDRMSVLTQDLQQALMQIGSSVYAHANATGTPDSAPQSTTSGNSDDVIDADFLL
jgi:molecular chaperone DnaK (HSP70)